MMRFLTGLVLLAVLAAGLWLWQGGRFSAYVAGQNSSLPVLESKGHAEQK